MEYAEIIESPLFLKLPDELKKAAEFIYTSPPLVSLTGLEFQKDEIPLTEKVTRYYMQKYRGCVNNPVLGSVKLDKEGVKDSLGHGMSRIKAAAYAAVPDIIQKGFLFDRQTNWKNRGYNTSVIIAPIELNCKKYFCEVIVKTGSYRQGFYLHELELEKKLTDVFKTATGSTSASSKLIIADLINKLNPDVK